MLVDAEDCTLTIAHTIKASEEPSEGHRLWFMSHGAIVQLEYLKSNYSSTEKAIYSLPRAENTIVGVFLGKPCKTSLVTPTAAQPESNTRS